MSGLAPEEIAAAWEKVKARSAEESTLTVADGFARLGLDREAATTVADEMLLRARVAVSEVGFNAIVVHAFQAGMEFHAQLQEDIFTKEHGGG